jgi:hypothetical protein
MSVHWEVEIISRSSGEWVSPFMPIWDEEEARALMDQLKYSKRLVRVETVRRVEEVEKKRPH